MHQHVLAILIVGVCITLALAAIPPLPKAELERQSSLIIVGQVVSVSSTIEQKDTGFSERIYRIELRVKAVEKGDPALTGQTIFATTWQPARRPEGWVGPQGQNIIPRQGVNIRAYLTRRDEAYTLLVPNGFEVLPEPATAPATRPGDPS